MSVEKCNCPLEARTKHQMWDERQKIGRGISNDEREDIARTIAIKLFDEGELLGKCVRTYVESEFQEPAPIKIKWWRRVFPKKKMTAREWMEDNYMEETFRMQQEEMEDMYHLAWKSIQLKASEVLEGYLMSPSLRDWYRRAEVNDHVAHIPRFVFQRDDGVECGKPYDMVENGNYATKEMPTCQDCVDALEHRVFSTTSDTLRNKIVEFMKAWDTHPVEEREEFLRNEVAPHSKIENDDLDYLDYLPLKKKS